MFSYFMEAAAFEIDMLQSGHEKFKKRTIQSWKDSRNLPRKLKKKTRKRLIRNWDILSFMESDDFVFSRPLFKTQ